MTTDRPAWAMIAVGAVMLAGDVFLIADAAGHARLGGVSATQLALGTFVVGFTIGGIGYALRNASLTYFAAATGTSSRRLRRDRSCGPASE